MPYSHHSHSGQFCRHAKDNLEDIVQEAIRKGFEVYGLSEHAPRYRSEDLYPEEADLSPDDLQLIYQTFLETAIALRQKYSGWITLLIGLETDFITDTDVFRTKALLAEHPEIDYIVGSLHHVNGIPIDLDRDTWLRSVYTARLGAESSTMQPGPSTCFVPITNDTSIPELKSGYEPTPMELNPFLCNYLEMQHKMIRELRPEVVGHFDLCMLWTKDLDMGDKEMRRVWKKIQKNIQEVVAYGGLFEVNSAAFRKGWATSYPSWSILRQILLLGGRLCLSDDSHGVAQVGLNYHRLKSYLASSFRGYRVTEIYYLVPRPLEPADTPRRTWQVVKGVKQIQNDRQRVFVEKDAKLWDHPFWRGPFGGGEGGEAVPSVPAVLAGTVDVDVDMDLGGGGGGGGGGAAAVGTGTGTTGAGAGAGASVVGNGIASGNTATGGPPLA